MNKEYANILGDCMDSIIQGDVLSNEPILDEYEEEAEEEERLESIKEFLMKRCPYKRGYERTIYREGINDFIRMTK